MYPMVMVARGSIPYPAASPVPAVRRLGYGPVRFTFSEALSMVEQGILPEDATIELLNGVLVYRDRFDLKGSEIVEGARHKYVVAALGDLNAVINSQNRHLRTQSTLVCSESHAPIPDCMVLRACRTDYRDRLPQAADALCVVEVADSSYERDAGEKLVAYRAAGIEQYVIINLRNRTAEVYSLVESLAATYPPMVVVKENEQLALRIGDHETHAFPLREILP
jgi:Uma2 family endonuclease